MYNGPNKSGGNNNTSGQGQNNTEKNKSRKQRRKEREKAGRQTVSQVTSDGDKEKEKYCFRCGEISHRVKECPIVRVNCGLTRKKLLAKVFLLNFNIHIYKHLRKKVYQNVFMGNAIFNSLNFI